MDVRALPARRHCMVVYATYPLGETRVQREAEALVDAGYDVDVICLRGAGEPARDRHRDVEIHRLPMDADKRSLRHQLWSYVLFTFRAAALLAKLHRSRGYAAVQLHNLPDFLVFAALVPKIKGVPVILDLHDLMPEFFEGRFGAGRSPWLLRAIRLQERLSCRFADHVITVSDHWRHTLAERGTPLGKVSVVMNVADERIFTPEPEGRPNDGTRLIYHGTMTERYGLDTAIEAVGIVRDEIPEIHLTLHGKGDHLPALKTLTARLGLQAQVTFSETHIPTEQLPALIASCDIGLAPYRDDVFTDGIIPTKLMEYAVMRLPCIASSTSAISAQFGDSMVEFFRPGDAEDLARCIRVLHDDPERRAELAAKARNFTDRYNWAQEGGRYVALVDRLTGDRARRRSAR